ncbi:hypothetical protein [Carboxylicivirga linearis]|uniref:Carboxypeptidase regulatory-like domain-containing protein n=1 Tax=Carboxylicivirga linearis TaxID=1628157 RepID=A0ABS5JRE2_9BACT|nr:hypothetical protein [Carboxylicivirga linearis]MBS2097385.1 hypothetical protein [Carboxylicivirga linearis]
MKSLRAGAKTGFLFILIIWGLHTVKAQYKVEGRIVEVGSDYDDVSVAIECNGSKKELKLTPIGNFETYLEANKTYLFNFSKPGYVSKIIEFSTIIPDEVHFETIQPYYLPVRLFKTFEGVDTVFFNQPVAKIKFDKTLSDFADDRDYSLKVKYRIDKMRQKKKKPEKKTVVRKDKRDYPKQEIVLVKKEEIVKQPSQTIDKKEEKSTIDLPPLKERYPQGRTDEIFELDGRTVERTIFMTGNIRKIYLAVHHDWGGVFYFIDQADLGYRCISFEAYENLLATQSLDKKNK